MKYLVAGISLLNNDPYLSMKMGGVTLNNAGQLANILKSKVQEIDINSRIEPVAKSIMTHEFSKPNMLEMMPNRRPPASLFHDATNGRVKLNFHAGTYAGTGLDMKRSLNHRNIESLIGTPGADAATTFNGAGAVNAQGGIYYADSSGQLINY